MLRFPLRLTAELIGSRFARRSHPIQFLDPAEVLHQDSSQPVSLEKIRGLTSTNSPVIWIGGPEPLLHPGISHLVRALTQTGHFVFLETDGTLLRRRIHEFQPVPRLFFAVRLAPAVSYSSELTPHPSAMQLALEGIRAAQLSGFLIALHARVQPDSNHDSIASLFRHVRSIDVDGIIATAVASSLRVPSAALRQKVSAAQKLIGHRRWQSFSKLVEPLLSRESVAISQVSSPTTVLPLDQDSSATHEEVRIA
jgi:hypothetical protein